MKYAPLGTTGLDISRVGLGAWAIGGGGWQGGWGPQDDRDSVAAIHRALERGVNWIDTAPAYGFGRAESVVGEAVRGLAVDERPLLFTKCGLVWAPGEHSLSNSLAPGSIKRECEASLRRLGVDTIDLLQAHWPTEDGTPLAESWAAMAQLVDEGKVRYIGLSNFTRGDLAECERIRHVDTFQPELNLLVRQAAGETLPWWAEHDTGVIVYSPLRSGLLSGRFSAARVASLPDDDWRSTADDFNAPRLSTNLALVERLKPIAQRAGATLAELSIAWALAWPAVDGAIVGARNEEQVDGWVAAADVMLDQHLLDEIAEAIEATGAGAGPSRPGPIRPGPVRELERHP
ncbi:MAG TPA: aldo/keto reductase [Acidimicrobiales bacterium]|jgi:aryl-alcohol dehydrogenase-like predicted oxidoreductase|nr:aldo/keto reductase [Acidimicrobiales bacterium]